MMKSAQRLQSYEQFLPEQAAKLLSILEAEQARRLSRSKLLHYRPYPKQAEFHAAGAQHRERLFLAANRVGKTVAGAAELAAHLTGRYPDWWAGHRFDRPIQAWAAGVTAVSTRDVVQEKLLGPPAQAELRGTGYVPGDDIVAVSSARNIADAIDQCVVRYASGGQSILGFKSYEQGREKWQGTGLDCVWFDEEPPQDIYSEGMTRTAERQGLVWITFTPLLGMTEVVRSFLSADEVQAMA